MTLVADLTMSLDGYVAGASPTLEQPLGAGGESLHEWVVRLEAWRRPHGQEGGVTGDDAAVFEESLDRTGAYVMGRRMFSGGEGPWDADPNADGWWGDDPPFHRPVFVVTHHAREPVKRSGGTTYTFVTDGLESAVAQARESASGKDVTIAGGASVVQQALAAGILEELDLHVAPILLGGGVRLFADGAEGRFTTERVVTGPLATHIRYCVVR